MAKTPDEITMPIRRYDARGRPYTPPELLAQLPPDASENMARIIEQAAVPEESRSLPASAFTTHLLDSLRQALLESAKRRLDALRLYEPMLVQNRFHMSQANERIVIGANRSGKTLAAAMEVARAATGADPFKKYPAHNGRAFLVGKDGKHVGQTMWRKLGRAGAFKIIRDRITKLWRAYRPWLPEDRAREEDAKLASPLLPPRLIKNIAWENKGEGIPNLVTLHNGWELSFFSSLGKPPQGADIDLVWFDEEIRDAEWYPEMAARLIDRRGKFIWSATPQVGTQQLYDLHERAEDERNREQPRCEEFLCLMTDNVHFSEEQRQEFVAKIENEEQLRVRVDGEFAITSFHVFPTWSPLVHGCDDFEVPRHWTRYAAIDPGHQVCAVLFAAVPPPEDAAHGQHVYLYDELYIKRCDAAKFGEMMGVHGADQTFEAFLIDGHMARHTELGIGKNVEQQYSEALKANRVQSRRTGFGFIWGSDDVAAGIEAIRAVLRIKESGKPKWLAFRSLGYLSHEMKRYHYVRGPKGELTDKPVQKNNHLIDSFRYLALANPRYRKPVEAELRSSSPYLAYKRIMEQRRQKKGEGALVHLGPTARR